VTTADGLRIGVDLGGTKTEAIALDHQGQVKVRQRVASPKGNYEATVRNIRDLVLTIEEQAGETGSIGIAIPGTVSPTTGLIMNANSTWLIGHPFDQDLEAALGRPVRLANDANCFALSEAVDGAGQQANVVFGVIIGTGTGGGVVVERKVITGPNSIAGEWGHNSLPWMDESEFPGPPCYCGLRGCIETFASGTGLANDHERITGTRLRAEDIVSLAEAGDDAAEATLVRYERRLGKSLASILNVLDPDIVVLGGGLSNLKRLYANLPSIVAEYAFSDSVSTPIVQNNHGDSGGVRGAAWLWGDSDEGVTYTSL